MPDQALDITGGTVTLVQGVPARFTAGLTDVAVQTLEGAIVELGGITAPSKLSGVYAG